MAVSPIGNSPRGQVYRKAWEQRIQGARTSEPSGDPSCLPARTSGDLKPFRDLLGGPAREILCWSVTRNPREAACGTRRFLQRDWLAGALVCLLVGCAGQAEQSHVKRVYGTGNTRPQIAIQLAPLGYLPPGELPAFSYYSLVSLHFFDATHLLFAFNTTGLLQRDDSCSADDSERLVRATLLDLPSGAIRKQAEWKLYDFADFLWNIGGGQFLLRRCSQLDRIDASLAPSQFISMAGSLLDIVFSPDHSMLLVEEKPPPKAAKPAAPVGTPAPVDTPAPVQQINVEFLRLHPLAVVAKSSVGVPVRIPILNDGFIEESSAPKSRWVVSLQPFHAPLRQVMTVRSSCAPVVQAISNQVIVATICDSAEQSHYEAYNLQGSLLWRIDIPPARYNAQFVLSRDGAHFAIEALHLTHPIAALDPLNSEAVDGQIVEIYDSLTGTRIATFDTTPVYTAGGNFDFSPDGKRVAILHDGRIEVYDLAALPGSQPSPPR